MALWFLGEEWSVGPKGARSPVRRLLQYPAKRNCWFRSVVRDWMYLEGKNNLLFLKEWVVMWEKVRNQGLLVGFWPYHSEWWHCWLRKGNMGEVKGLREIECFTGHDWGAYKINKLWEFKKKSCPDEEIREDFLRKVTSMLCWVWKNRWDWVYGFRRGHR